MKKLFTLLVFVVTMTAMSQSVAISDDGSVADGSAILEVKSTTKGFLPPRMNNKERDAMTAAVAGLQIWCTDCVPKGAMYFYNGSEWSTGGTGITSDQKDAIAANTDKEGITSDQKVAITANTDKEGITSGQAANIITNNGKTSDINHVLISSTADLVEDTNLYYTETRVSANTDVSTNKTNIASETARVNDLAALITNLQTQTADLQAQIDAMGSGTAAANLPSVNIGNQTWQLINLDVATYRDGTPIPQVTDQNAWRDLKKGAWCYYNNDVNNGTTYGKLYNWYAVMGIAVAEDATPTAEQKALRKQLAPTGWHVPSDAEWTKLTGFLGDNAGGKMKETKRGTAPWNSPNGGATNSSGFTGLPGGYRYSYGQFYSIGDYGYWWSSTEGITPNAWHRGLDYGSGSVDRNGSYKTFGFSVRCLRD